MSFRLTKFGAQKSLNEIPSHGGANRSAAHTKYVHLIVRNALPGGEMIVYHSSTDATDLVGTY